MGLLQRLFRGSKSTAKAEPYDMPIQVSLEQVKQAVLEWERDMGEEFSRTSLMREDRSLDLHRLRRYLGGTSTQCYCMSRNTFQIFEECDKDIPRFLDMVQEAVDDYLEEHPDLPIIEGSRNRQVHYDRLIDGHYLKEKPSIPLYITTEEFLLTHKPDWHMNSLGSG
ncbi:DUF3939 domain-containing protein [Paenibacillus marinisediminis]